MTSLLATRCSDVHSKPLGPFTVLVTEAMEDLAKALLWPIKFQGQNSKTKKMYTSIKDEFNPLYSEI